VLGGIRGTALATLSLHPFQNPKVNHYQGGVVPQAPDTIVQQSHQVVNIVASVERISCQNLCNDPINNVFACKEEKLKISDTVQAWQSYQHGEIRVTLSHYLMHTGVYIPTCLFCYV
jgi:hypothetical protein